MIELALSCRVCMEAHNLGSSYFDEYGETNVCQYITSRINISVSNTRTAAAINPMTESDSTNSDHRGFQLVMGVPQ